MSDKKIEEKIKALEEERDEYLNSWKRDRATLINYKDREIERTEQLMLIFQKDLFEKLIPIIDNVCLAEKSLGEELKNDPNVKGLLIIKKQLEDLLRMQGVEEIECIGKEFNPQYHEVVEEVEGSSEGEIVEVIEKGYKYKDKILRPAKVKISK
jgi:molecular chaperone GrpE